LVKQFADTYVEITPSGAGLRIWCLARTSRALKKALPDGGLEVYSSGRYFTVTANRFLDAPLEITDHQRDIDALLHYYAPAGTPGAGLHSTRIAEKITGGNRYPAFASLAGTLRKRGFALEVIEAAVRALNRYQCDPPKPDAELERDLRKILASAARWT
jgi:hypothetical protein